MENIVSSDISWILSGIGISAIAMLANVLTTWIMNRYESNFEVSIKNEAGEIELISLKGMSEKQVLEVLKKFSDKSSK